MSALTSIARNPTHHALRAAVLAAFPSLSWRHHGIGVLQAYLIEDADPEVRVHVRHPSLVKNGMERNGDVHDHRFDLVSHVIVGTVAHEEWLTAAAPDGEYETATLTHARAAAASNYHGPWERTGNRYHVRRNQMFVPAGSTYTFPASSFHRSPVTGLAVSVVEKHGQTATSARLLFEIGREPVMAFGHEMDATVIAPVLRAALEALGAA